MNLALFPLQETTLCRFVAFLVNQHLTLGTIRLYLSALRLHHIAGGGSDPSMAEFPWLHYVLQGTARTARGIPRPLHLPITLDILIRLFQVWNELPNRYKGSTLWTAATLGFFGFLRAGEFTVVPNSDQVPLTPGDVKVDSHTNPTLLAVTLRSSKTDPFGAGHTLYVGCTHSRICPVRAVLAYMAIRPQVPGPLFVYSDGTPLTRARLVTEVRAALTGDGMDLSRYTGHSFRIGAASSAARAGIPDSLIQTLGRWRSSAFQRYIRTPTATFLSIPLTLIQALSNPRDQA